MNQVIIGHKTLRERIRKLIVSGQFPQTSLLYGPTGTGKKLVALTIAQDLLCENPVQTVACGQCCSCAAFAAGSHPDFFLISPTKAKTTSEKTKKTTTIGTIKIEQITDVKKRLAYPPFVSRYQIVVIDDAELMNSTSANSLLKILEEPRPQKIFILVTGQYHRLLLTIRSRAARFYFPPLAETEVQQITHAPQDVVPTDFLTCATTKQSFADLSQQIKRFLQKDGDVPVFVRALRRQCLDRIALHGQATASEIEFLDKLTAAERQTAKHIQSEFILENLLS